MEINDPSLPASPDVQGRRPPPLPAAPPPRRSRGWLAILLLSLVLFVSIMVNLMLLMGNAALTLGERMGPQDELPGFDEIWSWGESQATAKKVMRIPVDGAILRSSGGGIFGGAADPVAETLARIQAATSDDSVSGIILEMNSPGGGVTASDEIYEALMRFKAEGGRKVVVHITDLAASGGYYIAIAGDVLIAEPTSLLGSIGVIMQTVNFARLSQLIGVTDTTIKSGENKDLLNPFREVSPQQKALLQDLIDEMYERFVGLIGERRPGIPSDRLRELADGRIFSSRFAKENGFIDDIGYWADAVAAMEKLLEGRVSIHRYERQKGFLDALLSARLPANGLDAMVNASTPQVLYLWKP
jgi:protease IV